MSRQRPEFIDTRLDAIQRMVIKVGTHLLRGEEGGLNLQVMDQLVEQIVRIRRRGMEVILVSSGAVGAGAQIMEMEQPPDEISARQALAAVGQSLLMHHYKTRFRSHAVRVAQVLLTRDGLDNRRRYLNVRQTLETLLSWNVLPIVNENDTVAIEELKFGDNDQLSAMIAVKMDADLLAILTDVDGLYDRPPKEPGAKRIPVVNDLSEVSLGVVSGAGSAFGLGGMRSKLEAVGIAMQTGILAHIGDGHRPRILDEILDGKMVGTWFEPQAKKLSGRKRWIAFGKRLCGGRITIDEGAERALLRKGRSLLPSGVTVVQGTFAPGDLVQVEGPGRRAIARGLVQYSSEELKTIAGMQSRQIPSVLGKRQSYEVIHRDDLVVFREGGKG